MAKNFTNFTLKTPTSGDFIVGYNADGSSEYKATVDELLYSYVLSDTTTVPAASSVKNIIVLSQEAYDNILNKNPDILYFII